MLKLIDNGEGGELVFENGDFVAEQGIGTPIYLALFGGDKDGGNWWGNFLIEEEYSKFHGDFEKTLRENLITKKGLQNIAQALDERLEVILDLKLVDKFENKITISAKNTLHIEIGAIINQDKELFKFTYRY